MNWVDFIIIGLIALSAIVSLVRGLIPEVLSLVTWVAAFAFALKFFPEAAPYFEPYLQKASLRDIAGFAAIFLITLIGGAIISFIIGALVKATGLKSMDRILGVVFGAARGALVVTLAVLAIGLTAIPQEVWWQDSQLLPHFERGAVWLKEQMPDEVRDHFQYEQQPKPNTPAAPATAETA